MYTYKANIIDVHDGDTVTAIIDLGFRTSIKAKIRLSGINAPELRGDDKENGLSSKKRLTELLLNKEVTINTFKDRQEKYGRWLGEIFVYGNQTSVNQILINEGLAKPY